MLMPPVALLPWLTYTDYLTKKLQARSGDAVLQVLSEHWCEANSWDQDTLNIAPQLVLHRNIVVTAWEKPCWYARTILPEATYQSDIALFARLQHEPLGNLIFQSSSIQRAEFQYYSISADALEYQWLPDEWGPFAPVLWLRSSTFQLSKDPKKLFGLVEILLPELEKYCE